MATIPSTDAGRRIVIRLGWEGNNEGSYPWAATGDGTSWAYDLSR